jgi:hypothetical protein
MAAPERFAEMADSSCNAGVVHTWHELHARGPSIEGQAVGGRSTVAKSSTISYTGFVGALSMSRCSLGSQGFPWVFGGAPRASFTGFGGCGFRGVILCAR